MQITQTPSYEVGGVKSHSREARLGCQLTKLREERQKMFLQCAFEPTPSFSALHLLTAEIVDN